MGMETHRWSHLQALPQVQPLWAKRIRGIRDLKSVILKHPWPRASPKDNGDPKAPRLCFIHSLGFKAPPPHIAISLGSPGAGMGASDRQALGPPPSSLCQLEQNLFCWIQRNPPPNLDGVGEPSGSKPALFLPCQTGREHAIPSALLLTR